MWEDIGGGGAPGSAGLGLGAPQPDEQLARELGLSGQPAVESPLPAPRAQPAGESHGGEREPVEVESPAPSRPPCERSVPPSGFICPECGLFFADPEQLLVHHGQAHVVQ